MALAADSLVSIDSPTTNNVGIGIREINTNKGFVSYDNVDNNQAETRIAAIDTGSLVFGSVEVVSPGGVSYFVSDRLITDKAIVAFVDGLVNRPKARVCTVIGNTVTAQALSVQFENAAATFVTIGGLTDSLALAAYRTTTGRYCRLDISGNTVTPDTPVTFTSGNSFPIWIARLSDTHIICMYRTPGPNNLRFQVLDLTSGITQGTPHTTGLAVDNGMVVALSESKAVCVYNRSGIKVRTINISGTTIDSLGGEFSVPNSGQSAAVEFITSSKILVMNRGSSPNRPFVETLTVDGDTITADGDGVGVSGVLDDGGTGPVAVLNNTLAVALYRNNSSEGWGARITGVPPSAAAAGPARFYQGAGALTEKFTFPFSGVEPGAMTLDAPLGTVVIGANTPAGQMVNFGASPYNAFTNMTDGIPTGTSATSVKWI